MKEEECRVLMRVSQIYEPFFRTMKEKNFQRPQFSNKQPTIFILWSRKKTRLLSQNCQLKRLLGQQQHLGDTDETDSAPAPKRRLIDTGQRVLLEDEDDMAEIQNKLDKERRTRMALEERVRGLENQLISTNRKQIIQRYSTDEVDETSSGENYNQTGQTVLTPAAKKQGLETLVLESSVGGGAKLPSIIQCVKNDGGRLEVEQVPRLADMPQTQALEITNVQDPETGVTRQYIVTTGMCDTTSKQNLETIVEAIRHLEGDHLFSEEAGPHQVVKEEVVESCIIEDNVGNVVEMTLPSSVFSNSAIINSLPQVPVPLSSAGTNMVSAGGSGSYQLAVSLPTVPVASMQNQSQQIQVPVTVSNLVSSLQQPLPAATFLPQVPVSLSSVSLPQVTSATPAPELGHIVNNVAPPQTSPVNLELAGSGSLTPTSEMNHDELTSSPPQSSPVNLAQSSSSHLDN